MDKFAEYKVLPFTARVEHSKKTMASSAAADQIEALINEMAEDGWEYVSLESLQTVIAGNNGCFGLGATQPEITAISMVVFRK